MAKRVGSYGGLDPRTARAMLVPDYATNVPADVATANETAGVEVAALERAAQVLKVAKRTAREAKGRDVRAAIDANRADKRTPPPTEANAHEAVEVATRTRDACARAADNAICLLHETWAAHQRPWVDAQEPVTDRAVADLVDLVDQVEEAFTRAAEQAGIERGLRRFDPSSTSPKERTVSLPAATPDLTALRDAAAELVTGRGRTRLEGPAPLTPEQQALADMQRTYREIAQGGVVATGT